jgi:hypothetical protein
MKLESVALGVCAIGVAVACSSDPAPVQGGNPPPPNNTAGTGANTGGQSGNTGGSPGAAGTSVATAGAGGGGVLPNTAGTNPGTAGTNPGTAGAGGTGAGGTDPGAGGTGQAGGAGPTAGTGNTGGANSAKSAGCGRMEPLNEPPRAYVKHDMIVDVAAEYKTPVDYSTREYHTWLPDDYDPNRAYPLYFWGNGCGVKKGFPEGVPIANIPEVTTGAILVFMIQEDNCFDAGKGGLANTPDIPYFEKMLNEIEANYCVDTSKVFAGGYSSGAWFAATLSCSHGDRLNAIGMAAGGQQDELPMCTGPAGLLLWAGNEAASGNPIDTPPNVAWEGSAAVRDRLIAENGCGNTTTKWNIQPNIGSPDPNDPTKIIGTAAWSSCNLYDNCGKNPVVFCPHGGGHDPGVGSKINADGMWKFFKSTW